MKRIAVTVWMGMTVRNLLYGLPIERLSQENEVTIISNYESLLREAFSEGNNKFRYKRLQIPRWQLPGHQGRLRRWLYNWNYVAFWLDKKPKMPSIILQWERENRPIRFLMNILGAKIVRRLRRGGSDSDFLRDIAYYLPVKNQFSGIDVVLVSTTDTEKDQMLIYSLKKSEIPVVCLVHSWDNLPSHGLLPAVPDRLLVWNSFMAEEAIRLHNVPRERIDIVGVPQYETYRLIAETNDEDTFRARLKVSEDTKIITYTGAVGWVYPDESELLKNLLVEIKSGRFGKAILVFRLHPTDERTASYIKEYMNTDLPIRLDKADSGFAAMNTGKIGASDSVRKFVELMQFSDVVLNIASTISLDAILFNTPVICPKFSFNLPLDSWNSTNRLYDSDHFSRVVKSGAVSLSNDMNEMAEDIDNALNSPTEKEKERQLLTSKLMPNLPTSRLINESLQRAIKENQRSGARQI